MTMFYDAEKKEIVIYIVCGIFAAGINLSSFYVLDHWMHIHYLLATAIAWVCSTTFAFLTNKFLVFRAYDVTKQVLVREIITFLSSRGISGLIDLGGMYLLVSCLGLDHSLSKCMVLGLIVATNYLLSRYWVFRKGRGSDTRG